MDKRLPFAAALLLLGAGCFQAEVKITSFEECVAAGNPVMESYPRQCRADGVTYVEKVPEPVPPQPEPEPQPEAEATYDQPFTLKIGGMATFFDGLRVRLMRIDDSRCPKDVQCVWAGELGPILEVVGAGPTVQEVRLGTTTRTKTEIEGYAFELKATTETETTIVVTKI
jgi:hypothetical protein